jgi:hypothetical protein
MMPFCTFWKKKVKKRDVVLCFFCTFAVQKDCFDGNEKILFGNFNGDAQ